MSPRLAVPVRAALPNLAVLESRRRLRRRWPGVSAGLWPWRGPARRTPGQSRSPVIQLARTAGSPVCAPPSPSLPTQRERVQIPPPLLKRPANAGLFHAHTYQWSCA